MRPARKWASLSRLFSEVSNMPPEIDPKLIMDGLDLLFTIGSTIVRSIKAGDTKATMVRKVVSVVQQAAVIDKDVDDVANGRA